MKGMDDIGKIDEEESIEKIMVGDEKKDEKDSKMKKELMDIRKGNRIEKGKRIVKKNEIWERWKREWNLKKEEIKEGKRNGGRIEKMRDVKLIKKRIELGREKGEVIIKKLKKGIDIVLERKEEENRRLMRKIEDKEEREEINGNRSKVEKVNIDGKDIGGKKECENIEKGGIEGEIGEKNEERLEWK